MNLSGGAKEVDDANAAALIAAQPKRTIGAPLTRLTVVLGEGWVNQEPQRSVVLWTAQHFVSLA